MLKSNPCHMSYDAQFECSLNSVVIDRTQPPNLGKRWGSAPWDGAVAGPKKAPPHISYHVKCRSSTTKGTLFA